mmetsp:Transcript_12714/g.26715  ORF Transcript_12714/g.26715 Transcript_12714/m.26715 type:complete len:110 (-) Transcript_12714:290-619(-)|eukprot:CAMPEP_0182532178 /NCGR_PEP_ID=MMETSP1323-20130603/10996_1 /TAXON_ID=236787 /ORGANISM="Florenciella parvula, Strain RCC1693" /LENGTH=109 /DNA_ID=CAMNT_0024741873 /DNA_START=43 /DNA_END=372 /DNA_ORIENTATION=-
MKVFAALVALICATQAAHSAEVPKTNVTTTVSWATRIAFETSFATEIAGAAGGTLEECVSWAKENNYTYISWTPSYQWCYGSTLANLDNPSDLNTVNGKQYDKDIWVVN